MRGATNHVHEEVLLAAARALASVLRNPTETPPLPSNVLASLRLLEAALEPYADR